ncbi:hypothetical protein [Chryseobacterium aquaticum]|uniref:hypothetical protein n=1 Tax=Chryseobacterium aquaticum TaxID=452084 RepID=UPI002FCA8F22
MSDEEKRREKEWWDKYDADPKPRFMGNLFEPATVYEYILKYGVDPRNGNPETGESFQKKIRITLMGKLSQEKKKKNNLENHNINVVVFILLDLKIIFKLIKIAYF